MAKSKYTKTKAELEKYYKKIAARADQRLRNLEKLSTQKNFKNATGWAYQSALQDIKHFGGNRRFGKKAPRTKQGIISKIKSVERFLNAPTSTKTGIVGTYQKRADTINKLYGTNFTWEDLGTFFESGEAEKMAKAYGSDSFMKAIGTVQSSDEEIVNKIKEGKKVNIKTSNRKVNKVIKDILKNQNLLDKLF